MYLGNWIRQTTTTTGTGDLTLSTVSGWAAFSSQFAAGADGAADYFYYSILDDTTGAPLEAGIGRLSASTTLVRARVLATLSSGTYSEANTALSLPAGTKRVICADLAKSRKMSLPQVRNGAAVRYIQSCDVHTNGGNFKTIGLDTLYLIPFSVHSSALFSGAGVRVETLAASSTMKVGLYRLNINCEPGTLICETNAITTSANGYASAAWTTGSRRLPAGHYYMGFKSAVGAPQVFASSAAANVFPGDSFVGKNSSTVDPYSFATASDTGTALPTTCPAMSWVSAGSDYAPVGYLVLAAP